MTARAQFILFAALTLCASPRLASASPNFPPEVKKEWDLPTIPDCIVCHQNDQGGFGTATKPFARSLEREGLVAEDVGSLDKALAALKSQNTDSDGDGISDIDELQMGSDPDDGPGTFDPYPIPMTGCAMSGPSRADTLPFAFGLMAMACAWVAHGRRGARRRKRRLSARWRRTLQAVQGERFSAFHGGNRNR
jgi:hypothetical protein